MPTKRRKRIRSRKSLTPAEYAYVTGDESKIEPRSRDAVRLQILKTEPDGRLLAFDRTRNELLKEFPEYADKTNEAE